MRSSRPRPAFSDADSRRDRAPARMAGREPRRRRRPLSADLRRAAAAGAPQPAASTRGPYPHHHGAGSRGLPQADRRQARPGRGPLAFSGPGGNRHAARFGLLRPPPLGRQARRGPDSAEPGRRAAADDRAGRAAAGDPRGAGQARQAQRAVEPDGRAALLRRDDGRRGGRGARPRAEHRQAGLAEGESLALP